MALVGLAWPRLVVVAVPWSGWLHVESPGASADNPEHEHVGSDADVLLRFHRVWAGGVGVSTTAHTCHAEGCERVVPRRMFMCKTHWFALPKLMRDRIWATYTPGQERRMDPSPEYLDAAMEAVNYLAQRAGESA